MDTLNIYMNKVDKDYFLIENQEQLKTFYKDNKEIEWLAFDTEFISEKYYNHRLCLISVLTINGKYIIDVLKLPKINLFNKLLEDQKIIKITHAGENDYQILIQDYKIKPKNLYDTQISASFLGYNYPTSLQKLLNKELDLIIDKKLTVSDWEQRPLSSEQLEYSLNDILHLRNLMLIQKTKLDEMKRFNWVIEECSRMENYDFYFSDPVAKIFDNKYSYSLGSKEKIFLYRLHQWRTKEAKKKDFPERKILTNEIIKVVVNLISSGRTALENDRRISSNILYKYWSVFKEIYERKITPKEKLLLFKYKIEPIDDSHQGIMIDILYLAIKYKAIKNDIAQEIVMPKKEVNLMKVDKNYFPIILNKSWRKDLLGKDLLKFVNQREKLKFEIKTNKFILNLENKV